MNLAELQRAFFARIAQVGEPDPRLEQEIRVHGALAPSARLDLYANMYFLRLLEALRSDFPALAALLGEEGFEQLAMGYVRHHPSTEPSLDRFGATLEAHLREPAIAAEGTRADLADLAALEWARSEVLTEADAEPLPPDALAALGTERLPGARLGLIPALRVLTLGHEIARLWQALTDGEPAPGPRARPSALVVWRSGFDVFHAQIPPEEAQALRLAAQERTVEVICGAFDATPEPVQAAFAALASWLQEGMIARVRG